MARDKDVTVSIGADLRGLNEDMSRARTSVMNVTSSLKGLGPAGAEAQKALSGFAGAIVGGGGVMFALEAVRGLLRASTGWYREFQEETKKAADAQAKFAAETAKAKVELSALLALQGGDTVGATRIRGAGQIGEARSRADAALSELEAFKKSDKWGSLAAGPRTKELTDAVTAALTNLALVTVRVDAEISRAAEQAAAERLRIARAEAAERERLARGTARAEKAGAAKEEGPIAGFFPGFDPVSEGTARVAAMDAAAAAREATKAQEDYNREVGKSAAQAQAWGSAIGNVVGGIVTGQMDAAQAMQQIGQMIIQSVIQQAITRVTAHAAEAGAGAAASQAAIPVAGPVLAISAMGAVMSAVLGLLGNIGKAEGGYRVPSGISPITQLHPGEHVIPREIARRYEQGTGGRGMTVNVVATDAGSFARQLEMSDSAISRAMRRAQRRGRA